MFNFKSKKGDYNDQDLQGEDFENCVLSGEDFSKSNCTDANFVGANLEKAKFYKTTLINADFTGAKLQGANFKNAILTNANFTDSDIRGVNFSQSNSEKANFYRAEAGKNKASHEILLIVGSILLCILSGLSIFMIGFLESLFLMSQGVPDFSQLDLIISDLNFPTYFLLGISLSVPFIVLLWKDWISALLCLSALQIVTGLLISFNWLSGDLPNFIDDVNYFYLLALNPLILIHFILGVFITAIAIALIRSFNKLIDTIPFILILITLWLVFWASQELVNPSSININNFLVGNIFSLIALIFSLIIAQRILAGDRKYVWIRDQIFVLVSIGSTNFKKTNLAFADFSQANLKNADFSHSYLNGTRFVGAKSLNQAKFFLNYNLIILNLEQNKNEKDVIDVIVFIWTKGDAIPTYIEANLPKNNRIFELYDQWMMFSGKYNQYDATSREISQAMGQIDRQINKWLNLKEFDAINEILEEKFTDNDQIKVVIEARNPKIQLIPWDLWNFVQSHPHSDVVLNQSKGSVLAKSKSVSSLNLKNLSIQLKQLNLFKKNHPKVLITFGSSNNEDNVKTYENLEINSFYDIELLENPEQKEFIDKVYLENEAPWDIICLNEFNVSQTRKIDQIKLSENCQNYTVKALKYALQQAIASDQFFIPVKKTKLLILNTSKSLQLANSLADLSIPMIIFRQPLPEQILPTFLSSLLEEINLKQPLYLALKEAKKELKRLENRFPYLSCFPVLVEKFHQEE